MAVRLLPKHIILNFHDGGGHQCEKQPGQSWLNDFDTIVAANVAGLSKTIDDVSAATIEYYPVDIPD